MKSQSLLTSPYLVPSAIAGSCPIPASQILYGSEYFNGTHGFTRTGNNAPSRVVERASIAACTNGPKTRSCWSNGYSVVDDFDQKWPTTGVTRSYQLTMTNTTCNPDGYGSRVCLLFNGQYPGPPITANWGDMVSITVTNNMPNNGSATHWHGIRQKGSNPQDGVGGLTECPIPPGSTKTYYWQATQFGNSWYHSHLSSQYGDGLLGPLVIYGPTSTNWDIDLGPILVTDWFYKTSYQIEALTNDALQAGGPGPNPDNILINGKNKNDINGGGSYSRFKFTPGKKHLLRFANTGVMNGLRVSIDGHQLAIITSDMVPVKPQYADSVLLGPGQRYMVVVEANQNVGNYWMRVESEGACFQANGGHGMAIVSYKGAAAGVPTSVSTATDSGCIEPSPLTPWVVNTVGSEAQFVQQANALDTNIYTTGTKTNNQNLVTWGINMTGIDIKWDKPTLQYVLEGSTNFPETYNLIELPNEGIWTFWVIQEVEGGPANIPHPMHLHGHDFYILGKGTGTFDMKSDPADLQYQNPTRRDTSYLPAGGWMVIAFPTDNPGAWLFHCHIVWHISEGLGLQFLEASDQIPGGFDQATCNAWDSYTKHEVYPKQDSGLKRAFRRKFPQ